MVSLSLLKLQGYGLNEAVRDIKDLRARKNMNEKEISSLVQKINDLESQVIFNRFISRLAIYLRKMKNSDINWELKIEQELIYRILDTFESLSW